MAHHNYKAQDQGYFSSKKRNKLQLHVGCQYVSVRALNFGKGVCNGRLIHPIMRQNNFCMALSKEGGWGKSIACVKNNVLSKSQGAGMSGSMITNLRKKKVDNNVLGKKLTNNLTVISEWCVEHLNANIIKRGIALTQLAVSEGKRRYIMPVVAFIAKWWRVAL